MYFDSLEVLFVGLLKPGGSTQEYRVCAIYAFKFTDENLETICPIIVVKKPKIPPRSPIRSKKAYVDL
jgi:hypothetical protein